MSLVSAHATPEGVTWYSDLYWGSGDDYALLSQPKYREVLPGVVIGGAGNLGFVRRVQEFVGDSESFCSLMPSLLREEFEEIPEGTGLIMSVGRDLFEFSSDFEPLQVQTPVVIGAASTEYRKLLRDYSVAEVFRILSVLVPEIKGFRTTTFHQQEGTTITS